jgi:hypothetical protein
MHNVRADVQGERRFSSSRSGTAAILTGLAFIRRLGGQGLTIPLMGAFSVGTVTEWLVATVTAWLLCQWLLCQWPSPMNPSSGR